MTIIQNWLRSLGLERYVGEFISNDIDEALLAELDHDSLKEIGIASLGHRIRLLKSIACEEYMSPAIQSGVVAGDAPSAVAIPNATESSERRQLTVMFCDLVGSTALADRMDPEDYRQIIVRYREAVFKPLNYYGGFVAEYQGDGVLAYFGYPNANEDDAVRALRAGLDIVEVVGALKFAGSPQLQVRIGVATGLVVTNRVVNSDLTMKQDVLGGTINLASRLQAIAQPGTVIVTQSTERLALDWFGFRSLGMRRIKGVTEPVPVSVVTGPIMAKRKRALEWSKQSPLVGRRAELELLHSQWKAIAHGVGRVVVLSGEPGIGKSRIVHEFHQALTGQKFISLRYFGSPLHTNSAFYPIVEQIEQVVRFTATDTPEQKLAKFENRIRDVVDDLSHASTLLSILLSLPRERHGPVEIEGDSQRRKWIRTFADQIVVLSRRRPVLMIVEDAHWIDPTTLTVLNDVVRKIAQLPVLIVITHRPDFAGTWSRHDYVLERRLERFTPEECFELIEGVACEQWLPKSIAKAIVDKTDGVPLFIEELTKWRLELDEGVEISGADPFIVPETLQDSLTARLDRLGPVKEVAQRAAVFGRRFPIEVLNRICPGSHDEIRRALVKLIDSGLLERAEGKNESYIFRHALFQEAAYNSLLKSRRRALHATLAKLLDAQFPQIVENDPECLARHYELGEIYDESLSYWIASSRRSLKRLAFLESISQLHAALRVLKKLPDDDRRRIKEVDVHLNLGRSWIPLKGYGAPEVRQCYENAFALCRDLDDHRRQIDVRLGLSSCYVHQSQLHKAREIGDHCLRLARDLNDELTALKVLSGQGVVLLHVGDIRRAVQLLDEGAHVSEGVGRKWHGGLQHPGVACLAYGGLATWLSGSTECGQQKIDRARAFAKNLDGPYNIVYAACVDLALRQVMGVDDGFLEVADETLEMARSRQFGFWDQLVSYFRDWHLCVREGDLRSVDRMRATLDSWATIGLRFSRPHYLYCLAECLNVAGRRDDALTAIVEAIDICHRSGDRVYEAEIFRLQGDIYHGTEDPRIASKALSAYEKAYAVAVNQDATMWRLRALDRLVNRVPGAMENTAYIDELAAVGEQVKVKTRT